MRAFVAGLSIGRRIAVLTGLMLTIFAVALVATLIQLGGVLDKAQTANRAASVALAGEQLGSAQMQQRALQAEYVLFKDPALLQSFHASADAADRNRKLIVAAYGHDALVTGAVERAGQADAKHDPTVFDQLVPAADRGDTAAAIAAESRARNLVDAQLKEGTLIRDHLQGVAAERQSATEAAISRMRIILIVLSVIALLLGIVLSTLLAHSISRPVVRLAERMNEIADGDGDLTVRVDESHRDEVGTLAKAFNRFVAQIHALVSQVDGASRALSRTVAEMASAASSAGEASAEIAATVETVAHDSMAQADSATRLGASSEVMTDGVRRLAASAQEVTAAAIEADTSAADGTTVVERAQESMLLIEDRVTAAAQVIDGLGAKSEEIGRIVDAITTIADQTNLLALNAAIEAARAGDQGRGFAVVAEEVRQLAEEAQQAAQSISSIVGHIQTETGQAVAAMSAGSSQVVEGVGAVREAGDAFRTIRGHVAALRGQVDSVSEAVEDIRTGSTEVSEAVMTMAEVSRSNAAAADQVSASAEEGSSSVAEMSDASRALAGAADELTSLVGRFRI